MARSLCRNSCRLRSQICRCRQASNDKEKDLKPTPASTCFFSIIFSLILTGFFLPLFHNAFIYHTKCYLEVFVDSFSVSNASAIANATTTADWNVGFVVNSPGNGCKVSLHTINSRLFRGGKLISELFLSDYFGTFVTGKLKEPLSCAVFERVVTQEGVVWDLGVEILFRLMIKGHGSNRDKDAFLIVRCGDVPVDFTVDLDGNVMGSLLGSKRPCEYLFREEYWDPTF